MTLTNRHALAVLAALAALMALTRIHHFAPLPDASWAVFFAGGFYLRGRARWALPLLLVEAVLIDYLSTQHLGVSSYCITPSYWAIVPAYAALWLGGDWLRRAYRGDARDLLRLAGGAFVAISVCFVLTNGAFYWFGGRYPDPNWAEYVERFFAYYGYFLQVPAAYLVVGAALHLVAVRMLPSLFAAAPARHDD